ncbi:MAG: TetR/AcrR family transcriptional regulator [Aeromicrobium sp.]|nr:TetR/AcrR family transcriptional regulator [Aeromicrobium sp.]
MVPVTEQAGTSDGARPMRADARRNYEKIVAAAREVFAERGAEGSLDEIARRAGVGPGTLYRHFPTREDLIDELMRDWTSRVVADSDNAVAAGRPARETLVRWFDDLVRHLTLHRGAAAKLSAAMDDRSSPIFRKCQQLADANERVVRHLAETGELRRGVEPRHLMRLVAGVAVVADAAAVTDEEIAAMLGIVIDGVVLDPAPS